MNRFAHAHAVVVLAALTAIAGCSAPVPTQHKVSSLQTEVTLALRDVKIEDPGLKDWIEDSYGYAVFPVVGKGGIGIGGAYGQVLVYEQGKVIGTSAITQGTIGFQLGGQTYRELIFFENKQALDDFTNGEFEFAAQVSAVAITAGASADASFENGMAIFTVEIGGLMYEASVGGQKFSFTPID